LSEILHSQSPKIGRKRAVLKSDSGDKPPLFHAESIRTFFTEEGAEKYYTLSLGKEWAGGDVLEDYC
jgi:hypothetical protein